MTKLILHVAALAVLLMGQLGVAAAAEKTPVSHEGDARDGTFKTVQGDVTVVRENTRVAAIVGGPLRSTDRIQTGAESATSVVLKDGTVLSVGANTVVDLSTFRFDPTTEDGNVLVNLMRGTMRMTTGLIAKVKPEQVKVVTPTTVIGVRGTDFIVEATP
jgi:hypothetical protein